MPPPKPKPCPLRDLWESVDIRIKEPTSPGTQEHTESPRNNYRIEAQLHLQSVAEVTERVWHLGGIVKEDAKRYVHQKIMDLMFGEIREEAREIYRQLMIVDKIIGHVTRGRLPRELFEAVGRLVYWGVNPPKKQEAAPVTSAAPGEFRASDLIPPA